MAISQENHQLALVVSSNTTTSSYEELLESQKELLSKQICQLQNIVSTQCKLTGINPLSQEMAAGALSIKIGKRPRDLLNPKAIKYMQSIFSVKDEISKKEIRAISALFGLTATQVKDFFTGQRSRVRRLIRLSREKATQSTEHVVQHEGSSWSNPEIPIHPVPLDSMGPSISEAPSCSMQDEVLQGIDDSDKYFIANIFNKLRNKETFSGQVKLMEWILQIQNASVLHWFLTNEGVMILATWLNQAAIEEQTSVLHVILKVLCHLPLHRALPAHMSAILQSVNKLRFYRASDISNRAKTLLPRWMKMFARSQTSRRPNAVVSSVDAQNEMLLKQSISEIMENESLESKISTPGKTSLQENFENTRTLGSSPPVKLLTAPSDESNIKLLRGVSSSHMRERRKVQLVEQPGQRVAGRSSQATRMASTTPARPLSADDIQKAKMRAQFMRSKYGESYKSPETKLVSPSKVLVPPKAEEHASPQTKSLSPSKGHVQPKVEENTRPQMKLLSPSKAHVPPKEHVSSTSKAHMTHLTSEAHVQAKVEGHKKPMRLVFGGEGDAVHGKGSLESEEPMWKKCRRSQIPWATPPEMKIYQEWSVYYGESSKEIEVQNNRIKREKEVFYAMDLEIPDNPKEPWDQEMDYDDSLTPKIPTEQLPDDDNMVVEEETYACENLDVTTSQAAPATSTYVNNNRNVTEPDLELLAVLLKNPEIVFALTSGQGGSLTAEQTVRLLDAIKANGGGDGSSLVGNIVNGLVEKRAEEVEVSLPSPTPATDPVTSGWPPENVKIPFSRQTVTVNGDAYAIPQVHFQETGLPTPTHVAPSPSHQAISPSLHKFDMYNAPDLVAVQRNILAAGRSMPPQEAYSPPLHQRFPVERRNIPAVEHRVNSPSDMYFPPTQSRPRQALISEPRHVPAQPWTERKSLASSSYSVADSSYDPYGPRDFVQPGPPWARNGGFESWSPDNSPRRSHEYDGRGRSYDYRRSETSRTTYNSSRYRDRGGRDASSRRYDRWR